MKNDVRQPQQERSIEKKNKIIQAGYELFSETGYYGTNTQEIAKRAGVSTGIVYGYFKDKRDILICALNIYLKKVSGALMEVMGEIDDPVRIERTVARVVETTIKIHSDNAKMHNTLHSLAATDEIVQGEFLKLEEHITEKITGRLNELGVSPAHLGEKVHLAMNIVQSFAHEYVFDNHKYIDYAAMREIVVSVVSDLFKQ